MLRNLMFALVCILLCDLAHAGEPPIRYATRGEVLYLNQCLNCHGAREHWKGKNVVTNWKGLKAEVRRRQEISGLEWSNEDIEDVARYLNVTHYKYPWTD